MLEGDSVFYDENPDCPPDEKYKSLEGRELRATDGKSFTDGASSRRRLLYYKSADDIFFEYVRELWLSLHISGALQ